MAYLIIALLLEPPSMSHHHTFSQFIKGPGCSSFPLWLVLSVLEQKSCPRKVYSFILNGHGETNFSPDLNLHLLILSVLPGSFYMLHAINSLISVFLM